MPSRDRIELDAEETEELLRCFVRSVELGLATDNLDVVAMAEYGADLLIEKWEDHDDG